MDPFMQEIVSIISIILGVVVLTAWAMWIILRPSGDSKVQEFASESARDGLTLTVIENNELKNKVTRLERELKVLMSAGYGNTAEENDKEGNKLKAKSVKVKAGKEERLRTKDEEPKIKEKTGADAVLVGGASRGEDSLNDKEKNARHEVKPSEELKAKWKSGDERGTIKDKRSLLRGDSKPGKKLKAESLKVKDEGLKTKDEEAKTKEKGSPVGGASRGEGSTKHVPEKKSADPVPPKPAEYIQSAGVPALAESQRVTDKKEKKKIAAYLASVAETTERQMKEVEALEDDNELTEELIKYPDEDLKKIKGIGPHLEGKLKKAGISSYRQIAELSDDDVQRVAEEIGYFPRRIKRDEWVEQAQGLVEG